MRRVFIIWSLYFVVLGWGRRLAQSGWLSCVSWFQICLEWFRIPAWGVGDPGFKSQRPHHKTSLGFFWLSLGFAEYFSAVIVFACDVLEPSFISLSVFSTLSATSVWNSSFSKFTMWVYTSVFWMFLWPSIFITWRMSLVLAYSPWRALRLI